MVDYPNRRTNYQGFPLCARALLRSAEGPVTRPAKQWVSWQQGLQPHTHEPCLAFWHLHLPSISFGSHFSLSALTHSFPTWQSLSRHKPIFESYCFNALLCLGGDCSCPRVEDGIIFDWFHSPLLLPVGSSTITVRRPTNGLCLTRICCRKNNKDE